MTKTAWDYTELADAYLKRPDYADKAIDEMLSMARVSIGDRVCDVGAGVAHLTLMLAVRGLQVTAVEPNDAMRVNGSRRTAHLPNVRWYDGTGENTGQPSSSFDLVTFGSSFNVCDRPAALRETARLLASGGWFACMWNHRDLSDPFQAQIENTIKEMVPDYQYGTRREDQTEVIEQSGLFGPVRTIEGPVVHHQTKDDCLEAWRSHATLQRQAGSSFPRVVEAIDALLAGIRGQEIRIPYTTRIWVAQRKP